MFPMDDSMWIIAMDGGKEGREGSIGRKEGRLIGG